MQILYELLVKAILYGLLVFLSWVITKGVFYLVEVSLGL